VFQFLRRQARQFGFEASRANAYTIWEIRVAEMLRLHGVGTIIDVGANDGGYGLELIRAGWTGRIWSFEPLPDAWARLQKTAKAHPGWTVAPRLALSDQAGIAPFHEAGNSYSSSLLPMSDVHRNAAPESATTRTIEVTTATLDSLIAEAPAGPHFLKLDVQGAEQLVLNGARRALADTIVGVQMEMSLDHLYDGQTDRGDAHTMLTDLGYVLWDMIPGFRDRTSYRLLQYDAVYFRRP
ncbi:MAG: FkbM family methyltransferase, partial [Acetobacteraceae bacterium]